MRASPYTHRSGITELQGNTFPDLKDNAKLFSQVALPILNLICYVSSHWSTFSLTYDIIKCPKFCQFSRYKTIYLCGLHLLLSYYFKYCFYFIWPLFSFWHPIISLFITPLKPGKVRFMLEVHASGTPCFGMSSLKFSKSISLATRENAQSLDWDLHRLCFFFLSFVALSDPLHHMWVNQIPQVAPELLLIWLFLDPMPGAQFKRTAHWMICSCCSISFVGLPEWYWHNSEWLLHCTWYTFRILSYQQPSAHVCGWGHLLTPTPDLMGVLPLILQRLSTVAVSAGVLYLVYPTSPHSQKSPTSSTGLVVCARQSSVVAVAIFFFKLLSLFFHMWKMGVWSTLGGIAFRNFLMA